jgi:DNA (cytosine-5)-methyltransferase 1
MSKKVAAEFFAGIGLVRMALERAGWTVRLANDIDEKKAQLYRANFPGNDFRLGDIRDIRADDVPNLQLATASFPCIDLSLAGNRGGLSGKHSSAYWEFHRIIEAMRERRPKFVLLENVLGLLSSRGGDDLRSIVASLNKMGYTCDLLAVDAVHFVPQSRPRLFVVGIRGRDASAVIEHEARSPQVLRFIRANSDLKWSSVRLPPLPPKRSNLATIMERLSPTAPEWWDQSRQAHLYSQISPRHRALLRHLMKSRRFRYATVYKRVRPAGCRAELRADGVAGCLRTPRGGSSKQFVIVAGNGKWRVRNMTAREYARLQGVPDSFNIGVPYLQALFGFGDAVCVPAVKWVVRSCFADGETKRL